MSKPANKSRDIPVENQRVIASRGSMTQEKYAEKIGMSVDNLRKIERGETSVTLKTAKAIRENIGTSLDYIYGYTDSTNDEASIMLLYLKELFSYNIDTSHDFVTHNISVRKSVSDFLKKYAQATKLYESGEIDTDIYTMWIEKIKKDLNTSFQSSDDTSIFYSMMESSNYQELVRERDALAMSQMPRPM